jgi:hypothetical protein
VATFEDLLTFLRRDGWTEEPNLVRGGARTGDHRRFRKEGADGSIRRTKVPHGLRDEIGEDLFRHILRDQLGVTNEQFRATVRRGDTSPEPPHTATRATVPGWLVERLLLTVGLPEAEVRAMTAAEARAAWDAYLERPRQDDGIPRPKGPARP